MREVGAAGGGGVTNKEATMLGGAFGKFGYARYMPLHQGVTMVGGCERRNEKKSVANVQ